MVSGHRSKGYFQLEPDLSEQRELHAPSIVFTDVLAEICISAGPNTAREQGRRA